MITGHHMKRLEVDGVPLTAADCVSGGKLHRLLARYVVEPFQRITGLNVLVIPANLRRGPARRTLQETPGQQ